jgi:hypothetical protein
MDGKDAFIKEVGSKAVMWSQSSDHFSAGTENH